MRRGALVAVGMFIIGVAFAIFPWSGVTETWAAEHASSTTQVYQLVGLVAVGLVAFGMVLAGFHRSIPPAPFGFAALVALMGIGAWVGIGMLLGG